MELFRAAQSELIKAFGLVNTVLLLSGSLAVVLALKNLRERSARSISYLWLAIGTGLAFIADKIVEYTIEVGAGHTLESGRFFMYYYTLTGLHLLHVMLGVGVLLFMVFEIKAKDCSDEVVSNMESGSAIWHMVDLLWIGLFSLVYLI